MTIVESSFSPESVDLSVSRLFVSGMSGQVGQGLAEAWTSAGAPSQRLSALVRRRHRSDKSMGGISVEQVVGDVSAAGWGLNSNDYAQLDGISAVVNLAGLVDWTATYADMDKVNLLGAVNGLELARELSREFGYVVPYVYASTTYVAGTMEGNIVEDLHPSSPDRTPYELSKWAAERHLMREAQRSGHPVLVVRIGGVIGSSSTRSTVRMSSLYQLVSPLERGKMPYLPVRAGARVDVLPRDVIGEGLLRLLSTGAHSSFQGWEGGAIVHLCAGDHAPTLRALLALLDAKDVADRYDIPRLVVAPPRALRVAESVGLRYARWSREMGNRLHGLRYVSIDRIFERTRLYELAGGWWPVTTLDQILDTAFDLRVPVPDMSSIELPLGRFE